MSWLNIRDLKKKKNCQQGTICNNCSPICDIFIFFIETRMAWDFSSCLNKVYGGLFCLGSFECRTYLMQTSVISTKLQTTVLSICSIRVVSCTNKTLNSKYKLYLLYHFITVTENAVTAVGIVEVFSEERCIKAIGNPEQENIQSLCETTALISVTPAVSLSIQNHWELRAARYWKTNKQINKQKKST